MQFLLDLWLPILVATFCLHMSSFLAWVVLPHHFSDKKKLDEEDKVMDMVRDMKIPPGNYMFPYATHKTAQNDKSFQDKYAKGPVGCLDVYHPINMASNMIQTILFFFVTATVIAYITHVACPPGDESTDFMKVFRIAGTIGVLTYASSGILNRIWFRARRITDFIDGCVFGVILGLIFAALYKYTVVAS